MHLSIEVYNKGSKLSEYSGKSHETDTGNRPTINKPEILSIIDNAIERNNSNLSADAYGGGLTSSDIIYKKDTWQ